MNDHFTYIILTSGEVVA